MYRIKEGFRGLSAKQLKFRLLMLFILLLAPSSILIYKALTQLQWESFHKNRVLAEEFSTRINQKLSGLIELEQARKFTDYSFLNIAGDNQDNVILRSPLSEFPVNAPTPGLLGYFQIDNEGGFSTTYLPNIADYTISKYGISTDEFIKRKALQDKLFDILYQNQLLQDSHLKDADKQQLAAQSSEEAAFSGNLPLDSPASIIGNSKQELAESETENNLERGLSDGARVSSPQIQSLVASSEPLKSSSEMRVKAEEKQKLKKQLSRQKKALPTSQQAFDSYSKKRSSPNRKNQQNLGRVDQLQLNEELANKSSIAVDVIAEDDSFTDEKKRPKAYPQKFNKEKADKLIVTGSRTRRESNILPESPVPAAGIKLPTESGIKQYRLSSFQSEIDPFEFGLLDNGYLIIYRNVWRDDNRYIQGALIESKAFLKKLIETDFNNTTLANISNLTVALDKSVLAIYSPNKSRGYLKSSQDITGNLLYKNRFSSPFTDLQLIFSIQDVDLGQADSLIIWISLLIITVLCIGFYMMYNLGMGQIELLSQQQDFVSSVSHELKTPLTSIRMYGEMLREGWVSEEKQKEYYDYIHNESERLTRLINNVLQLSRLNRDNLQIHLLPIKVAELMDHIRSKISSQVETAEFGLNLECDQSLLEQQLLLDSDAFTQIIINLVDNAIKFSRSSSNKVLDVVCKLTSNNNIQFSIRDYGPGIDNSQLKKIFKLFYRAENEMTRETIGTGIGLALVYSLVTAMDGSVDVVNKNPGAEFRVSFRVHQ